jgi:hypothetical protein
MTRTISLRGKSKSKGKQTKAHEINLHKCNQ